MSETEVREFVAAHAAAGQAAVDAITAMWLRDREAAADAARDAIYDDARDSWSE